VPSSGLRYGGGRAVLGQNGVSSFEFQVSAKPFRRHAGGKIRVSESGFAETRNLKLEPSF
jgi:hypothetical protein